MESFRVLPHIRTAMNTVGHIDARPPHPPFGYPLPQWDRLLQAAQSDAEGMRQLRRVLLDPDGPGERLRDFSPFAGVLSREERRRARELCGFRH